MRAEKIINPIASLTPEERERLGFLVMWAIDGPEQGFLNRHGHAEIVVELCTYLQSQGIPAGGQMFYGAKLH